MQTTGHFDFSTLSPMERILLAQELWESVQGETAAMPLSPEQIAEIRGRIKLADTSKLKTYSCTPAGKTPSLPLWSGTVAGDLSRRDIYDA